VKHTESPSIAAICFSLLQHSFWMSWFQILTQTSTLLP